MYLLPSCSAENTSILARRQRQGQTCVDGGFLVPEIPGREEDLERMRRGRSRRQREPCDDWNERAVVGYVASGPVCHPTRYPGSTSFAPNATTSARVAERTTSPRVYIRTAP